MSFFVIYYSYLPDEMKIIFLVFNFEKTTKRYFVKIFVKKSFEKLQKMVGGCVSVIFILDLCFIIV